MAFSSDDELAPALSQDDGEGETAGSVSTEADDEWDAAVNRVLLIHPCSSTAALAFHDLCDRLKKQPQDPDLEHQRSFVVMGSLLPLQQYLFATSDPSSSFSTDSEVSSSATEVNLDPVIQTGHFELSFLKHPSLPSLGWTLGRGRSKLENKGVDLMLPSRNLRSVHASFRFNEHGSLIVQALRDLELDDEIVHQSHIRALAKTKHVIAINDLRFRVERDYIHHLETFRQKKLRDYLQGIGADITSINPLVIATPSDKDEFVGQWKMHGITGQGGGEVTVDVATNTISGEVFAVKRLVRDKLRGRAHDAQIKKSNAVESMLREAEGEMHIETSFLLRLREVVYSGDARPWREGIVDRVYIFTEPLCIGTFHQIFHKQHETAITTHMKQECFTQILLGLEFLHDRGWIHRDIKPTNLAIKSVSPPHALIIDFGATVDSAHYACTPEPGTCGTVGYLAPELENSLYLSRGTKVYDCAVDIFALGVVAQDLFYPGLRPHVQQILSGSAVTAPRNPFRAPIDSKRVEAVIQLCGDLRKGDRRESDLGRLIAHMLDVPHETRITAQNALAHRAIAAIATKLKSNTNDVQGRKRKYEM